MQSHYSVDQFGSEQLKLEIAHVKPVSLACSRACSKTATVWYTICAGLRQGLPVGDSGEEKKVRVNRWEGGCMKVTVDRSKCEGYAKCVGVTPKVFKLDEKFISVVVDAKGDSDQKILLAARVCPTKAIVLEEEDSGQRIFPQS